MTLLDQDKNENEFKEKKINNNLCIKTILVTFFVLHLVVVGLMIGLFFQVNK